jgi:RND family efflux transporter MFP subunit
MLVFRLFSTLVALFIFAPSVHAEQVPLTVEQTVVQDLKAVFATVQSVDVVSARARIGGTVVELLVDEGSAVKAGQKIARVVDEKLALQTKSMDARIQSQVSQRDLAKTALARLEKLFATGAVPRARLDESRSALEVAERALSSILAEGQVLQQTRSEGDVLAPAEGRVLNVHVTNGAVILPGEAVASLAADTYILRMQLPERHAQFIKQGDEVQVAERGLGSVSNERPEQNRRGYIRQVYPEIKDGRVTADVDVESLGDFFVGERIRVWLGTGERAVILVPQDYLYKRHGLTFAKLEGGLEVVVQPGLARPEGVEILSGLTIGDVLVGW